MSYTGEIKSTIRKLLNLAEDDAATEGEINNALRFARRLMERYHLDESSISDDPTERAADKDWEIAKKEQVTTYSHRSGMAGWEIMLANFICDFVGSVGWYRTGRVEKRHRSSGVVMTENGRIVVRIGVVFYGIAEEAQLATDLFEQWQEIILAMARLRYGNAFAGAGRCYAEGFGVGLGTKLQKLELEQKESTNADDRALLVQSTTVALAKRENADAWLTTQGITLTQKRANDCAVQDWDAYDEGKRDGKKAELSKKRRPKLSLKGV